jgi:hypothetical protein
VGGSWLSSLPQMPENPSYRGSTTRGLSCRARTTGDKGKVPMPRRSDAVITPNKVLVAARKQLPSPHRPGEYISRPELADAVNRALDQLYPKQARDSLYVDARWVGKLERGESRWPVEERRAALRLVFGVARDVDMALYSPRRTDEVISARDGDRLHGLRHHHQASDIGIHRRRVVTGLATPAISALISAVVAPFGRHELTRGGDLVSLEELTAELSKVRVAYQHSQYATAVATLPNLLAGLRRARIGRQDREAARLESEAYQVASGLLLKGDEPVLAAIAAERSSAAAERADDELAVASGARAVVHCLLADGHARQGALLAMTAADRLSAGVNMGTPAALSVYGALLLRGAVAAARWEDRDQAYTLLDEAANAAARLGADRNVCWTAFGPANVGAHRVAVAVDLGDAGSAVAQAADIELGQLKLPERKAMVLLDTARALTHWGKWDDAFTTIQEAERQAPEEVRSRPAIHGLIDDLVQRSPSSLKSHIREYSERIGVSV